MKWNGLALVGEHPHHIEVVSRARRMAPLRMPVLVCGETGTGKEMVARLIHHCGSESRGPFVPVDCSALSQDLARAELFGALRGAYTGSVADRIGIVSEAQGGTLFLDEIGELVPAVQAQLLRFLQEGEYRQVGGTKLHRCDVRVVAATNRDLGSAVAAGAFRADLYYRLRVLCLGLSPLRERRSDIPLLVEHFVETGVRHGMKRRPFSRCAMRCLIDHDWPGNVRQLSHTVLASMATAEGRCILPGDLDLGDHQGYQIHRELLTSADIPYREARRQYLDQFDRDYLHQALVRAGGNVTEAAKRSGIGRQYFQLRMSRVGFRARDYRSLREG